MPSRWIIRCTASRKPESARLDSTWARVERVMRGYLAGSVWRAWKALRAAYVRAIDRIPPPAPERACATLKSRVSISNLRTENFAGYLLVTLLSSC